MELLVICMYNSAVPTWTLNHVWTPRPGVCPAVVATSEVRDRFDRGLNRVTARYWTVDYEFGSYGRYRTASPRLSWQARLPRTMHLYPPGLTYWEDVRAEVGFRHSAWLIFTGGEKLGLARLLHPRRRYARFEDPAGALGELFAKAARIGPDDGDRGFWECQALLCQVIALALAAVRVDEQTLSLQPGARPRALSLVEAVGEYLRPRLAQRIYVRDIARHLHMSAVTLAHRLHQEAGETPMGVLARLRTAQAKAMLLRGLPLKEIAARLGFCDAFHFSKVFKRVEGVTPSAMRRRPHAQG